MTPYLRIYPSEQAATAVAAKLTAAGLPKNTVFLASQASGKEAETVHAGIRAGKLPERQVRICTRSLQEGNSLLTAEAPFGRGQEALDIMESETTVYTDKLKRYVPDDPTPLSDVLAMATLSDFSPATELVNSSWTFSSKFGMRLLSKSAAPFSSLFKMKVLKDTKRDWNTSFGMPLLSRNPSPLSALFGLKTVSKSGGEWRSSFGLPLLIDSPAPLSRLLALKTLTKEK